ncbi:MAG TPA: hypothetical protein PK728_11825 [Bacillota bacterium]|nr:hypothetical protein [Bacillota bacterium]
MKTFISLIISFTLFLACVHLFQIISPNTFSLLIYPAASSVICSLVVLNITQSAVSTFASLIMNNLVLLFVLVPLPAASRSYLGNLKYFFFPENSFRHAVVLAAIVFISLFICWITVKTFFCRYGSRNVYISKRHMNRYLQENRHH